jgi:serine/threonine protein kinase
LLEEEVGMISKTVSHYKIIEKLYEGGMGVVYRAQDAQFIVRQQNFYISLFS